jgi:hypothetical protein
MIIFIFLLSVFPFTGLKSQGNLVIIPRRVVFEGTTKSQEITLANGGIDTAKYAISIVQMRMKEDGTFEEITVPDPGQNFATNISGFIRVPLHLPPRNRR